MNLHTFELTQCLQPTDVPHLIRWLARLPNIVHLILKDDAIGKAATTLSSEAEQTNIYEALASPAGGRSGCGEPGGWLCPSLTILHLDTDDVVADLIPIARARGGFDISAHYVHPPKALRRMEALICSSSSQEEKEELCSLVEQAICVCISCGLAIAGTYFY
ncbi:hypothetical protein B0H34DRAFT_728772 [Crassisporium funariophilum]|nr:hypothetical protein B0H34DRAFT_728772 [Crassisporium funariophilum]